MFLVTDKITEYAGSRKEAKTILLNDNYRYACFLYSDPLSVLFNQVKPEKVRLMADWEGQNFWFPEVPTNFLYPSEHALSMVNGSPMAHFCTLSWAPEDMSRAWIENRMPESKYVDRIAKLLKNMNKRRVLFYGSTTEAGLRGERRREQLALFANVGLTLVSRPFTPTTTHKLIDVLEDTECFCVLGMDGLSIGCKRDHEVALSCVPYLRLTNSSKTEPYVNPTRLAWVASDEKGLVTVLDKMRAMTAQAMNKRLIEARDLSICMLSKWRLLQCIDSIAFDSNLTFDIATDFAMDEIDECGAVAMIGHKEKATATEEYTVFDSSCDLLPGKFKIQPPDEFVSNYLPLTQSILPSEPPDKTPLISFIVPCMGRLSHLKKTLHILAGQPRCEVVVVDWSCPDRCGEWAKKIASTRVISVPNQDKFNLSKARNAGAKGARGEWLCFLDCDMIVSGDFSTKMAEKFRTEIFLTFGTLGTPGHSGMTTCRREDWKTIGGYDERMEGWGYEDTDFKNRLMAIGIAPDIVAMSLAEHIEHENEDRVRYYAEKQWDSHEKNRLMSDERLKNLKAVVGFWAATHSSWVGFILFNNDGTFERYGHHDKGKWSFNGKTLVLKWDQWPAEKVEERSSTHYVGAFLTLKKITEEEMDSGDLKSLYCSIGGGLGDMVCALSALRSFAKHTGKKVKLINHAFVDVLKAYGDDLVTFGYKGTPASNKRLKCVNDPKYFGRNYLEGFTSTVGLPLGKLPELDLPPVDRHPEAPDEPYVVIQPYGNSRPSPADEVLQSLVDRCRDKFRVIVVGRTNTPHKLKNIDYLLSDEIIDILKLIRHASFVLAPHSASAHIASAYKVPSLIWADLELGHEMHLEYPGWKKQVVSPNATLQDLLSALEDVFEGRFSSSGITTKVAGRLGNQMFQYAVPRLLAQEDRLAFKLEVNDVTKRWPSLATEQGSTNRYLHLSGDPYYHSHVECVELLVRNRGTVRSWFGVSDFGKRFLSSKGNPPVIHIRGGDFLGSKWILDNSYYKNAIKELSSCSNPIVITDDVSHARSLLPDLEAFSTEDDLSVLVHATELVCSLSTYCWWGAFLGDHETVVAPDKYDLYKAPAQTLGWKRILTEEEDEFKDGNPDFVGEWNVDHDDWSETMVLSKEGTFHRVQSSWENGKWQITEDGVSLKWQNWAEEKAKYNNGKLIGDRFVAYRPWRLVNPKISYCTTCKGRLWQLSQTYLKNIQTALNEYNNVEFILLDYQSNDGLEEWAKNELSKYVENGVVKYVKLMDNLPWHVSKAKNMAHRVASGCILCNLDADNFLGDGFTKKISYEVAAKRAIRLTGHESVGGRIAVYKDDFFIIGGYDEELAPMGYQDIDLEIRLAANGVKVIHLPTGPLPVGNSDEQRAEFCGMSYKECCVKSRNIMRANASSGRIVANVAKEP